MIVLSNLAFHKLWESLKARFNALAQNLYKVHVGILLIFVCNFGNLDRECLNTWLASPQDFWGLGQNNFGHFLLWLCNQSKKINIFMPVDILINCYAMLHLWKGFSNFFRGLLLAFSRCQKNLNGTGYYYRDAKCLLRKLKLLYYFSHKKASQKIRGSDKPNDNERRAFAAFFPYATALHKGSSLWICRGFSFVYIANI